ncbi:MAG TPA: periplasmic heavy metal sensor [Rubrivivax sp.]|nr:periplasmic heavy metal sensor [Rubrivivax sp.]
MRMHSKTARVALAGLALAGLAATSAQAQPGPGGPGGQPPMMAFGHGGHGGPGGMFDGMLTRLLDRVHAPPEQRTQIQQIVQANAGELRAQREAGRTLREQAMALFAQPTVDANALEALRQKQLAQHDAASKRMTAAMLEVSRVLTPEQRRQMADYMTQRREMMLRHQRERRGIEAPRS